MIQTVSKTELPVGEMLTIQKNRITGGKGEKGKRICIVTGTHGDELEGQYIAYRLASILQNNTDKLDGVVDIYPALNPFGVSTITRGLPQFDLDMNRVFPGTSGGSDYEYTAKQITKDLTGADLIIDLHASNIFLREMPQIRINEVSEEKLLPIAMDMNMDFIWIHANATVLEGTLAYSMNAIGVPTLVVEMGVGMRITKAYGEQVIHGIFKTMNKMGIWKDSVGPVAPPIVSRDGNVEFLNAGHSGIFIPRSAHASMVHKDQLIGEIADPLTGTVLEEVKSPVEGLLFTLREYPVVNEGSLLARILGGVD